MADNRNRLRPKQIKFFVNDKEYELIKQKMAQLGTDNMSAYLRKMAIDGYVVNLDRIFYFVWQGKENRLRRSAKGGFCHPYCRSHSSRRPRKVRWGSQAVGQRRRGRT